LFTLTTGFSQAWSSQNVTLAWDPVPGPGVSGYELYYGTVSGNYSTRLNVGTNISATVTNLKEGHTNYFVVTAYNSALVEGPPSTEVAFIVPGLLALGPKTNSSGRITMRFPVASGHWYEVQASTNLTSWATIWKTEVATSNAWVVFQDPQAASYTRRFYRLALH
jgi:hypothetical protein